MFKGKGGYILIPIALLFAENISQEEKVKKLLDHGKPVLLTEIGDGKNDVFVMPKETDDGVLLENVYGYDILVGEEETTSSAHKGGTHLYLHKIAKNEYLSLYLFSTSGDSKVGKTLEQVLQEETTIDIKYKWRDNYHEIFFNDSGATYVPSAFSTSPTYNHPTPILDKSDEITIDEVTSL